ncbi:hypothetical protein [Campylobacter sp. CCS1377]|uniref:Autotransporter n=1 Tax=Campylobacter sp. CCS1377 TaxID=3158229 RepID=A0AAU7E9I1_9BACT|nr:hypothetical protein [Campylobacter jejuni]
MQFLQNNKFKKRLLSHSAILIFALFNSPSIYAQECSLNNGQIVGKGDNSIITIKEKNKYTIDGKECSFEGQFDTVAGGIGDGNTNMMNNKITISNGQTIYNLYGSKTNSGSSSNNKVIIDNAQVIWKVYGGYSEYKDTVSNLITISDNSMA